MDAVKRMVLDNLKEAKAKIEIRKICEKLHIEDCEK